MIAMENGEPLFFLLFKDLQSWGLCAIHTGAAASARTMDSALHSPSPMNLAMCKHTMFPLIVYCKYYRHSEQVKVLVSVRSLSKNPLMTYQQMEIKHSY